MCVFNVKTVQGHYHYYCQQQQQQTTITIIFLHTTAQTLATAMVVGALVRTSVLGITSKTKRGAGV